MDDPVGDPLDALAEGVVVTVLVVVTHLGFLFVNEIETGRGSFLGSATTNSLRRTGRLDTGSYCVLVDADVRRLELRRTNCLAVVGEGRLEALSVFAFGNVDGTGVVAVVGVYFNARFADISRADRSESVGAVKLLLDAGTAVKFFFTCKTAAFLRLQLG